MSSKEDYLDDLLKNITHNTEASHPEASHPEASHPEDSNPEEEKTVDENVQPEVEPDQESGISVPESEQEAEVFEPESEQEAEIFEPESEQESEVFEPESEQEAEVFEPESEQEAEVFMPESGAENILETKMEYPEEFLNVEESGMPDIAEENLNIEEREDLGIEESEVLDIEESEISGIVENEILNVEAEAAEEIPMPEEEPEAEATAEEIPMPEYENELQEEPEWEAAEEITMPEEEYEPEAELENIIEEALASPEVEIPDMEEAEILDMEEAEIPDIVEQEIPDMEEAEIPDMVEPEISDMEEAEFPNMDELSGTSEDEISGIEELIADMGEDISDMEGNNLTEDDETLNVDDLLSGIGDFADLEDDKPEGESLNSDQVPALDDVMEMSEDDIEKLLSKGFVEEGVESADTSEQDVLDILDGTADDEDLQDIQDMLQKSDNNEAVDDEIVKLLQGVPEDEEDLEERILPEDRNLAETGSEELDALIGDTKKQKALEKKRLKEEKAAAKKAAKEAAKAKKAAKKRAKKAKKTRQNKNVQDIPIENENGEELFFDRDELDRLVSKAGQIGDEEPETEEGEESGNAGEDDFGLNLNDLFAGDEGSGDDALQALTAMHTDGQSGSGDSEAAADKKKKKKEKKEKAEKTGFLSKILSFLMEEDEEDEKEGNLRLSEENRGILNDLDKQGKTVKGGKGGTGGKKDKKKDDKKEKPKKEAKPKKEPKPKAEKPPKEPEPYVPPRKRLTPKKVLPVVLLGITAAAAILIFVNVSTDYVDKRAAKTAYYNGDYATCYQNLNGKELNETEAVMYGRSESILYIRLWYREYEMFVEEGAEVKALDSLIQTVKDYPMLYEYASKWHAEGDVYTVYADILNILLNKYGITELQAKEIAKERDDLKYTRMVVALAEGKPYGSWNQTGASVEDDSLPHELPEESDLGQGNFVDNR